MKKFNIIYADPPYPYADRKNSKTTFGLGMHRYPPMKIQEICDLPVTKLTAENCALFLWIPSPKVIYLNDIMTAWGFRFITKAFSWIKISRDGNPRLLPGHYTGSNTEDCWLGVKGRMYPYVIDKGVNQIINEVEEPTGYTEEIITHLDEHSKKPEEARERIVQLFGKLPRIELFARQRAWGWSAHGNQVNANVKLFDRQWRTNINGIWRK